MKIEMNAEQKLALWKDFAIRMAKTCYAKHQSPSLSILIAHIEDFFESSLDPEHVGTYTSWEGAPAYVCDRVPEYFEYVYWRPWDYCSKRKARVLWALCDRWDEKSVDYFDELRNRVVDAYESPLHCCVRAGMDFVYEPSAGVLGFTAGDLRRMYDGIVPDWIASQYEDFAAIPDAELLVF